MARASRFGEPFVCGLGGLEGIADQPTLENHGKDYRTNRGGTRGELDLWRGGGNQSKSRRVLCGLAHTLC